MKVSVANFRAVVKNTLLGFFDLTLDDIGLQIVGCSLHERDGNRWIGYPGKPYKDKEGKESWANIVNFTSREAKDKFSMLVHAALDKIHKV
jgi:hypothetical protein